MYIRPQELDRRLAGQGAEQRVRVVDVRRALADPATDPRLRPRLETAWHRTAAVADALGAPAHGLRPITG